MKIAQFGPHNRRSVATTEGKNCAYLWERLSPTVFFFFFSFDSIALYLITHQLCRSSAALLRFPSPLKGGGTLSLQANVRGASPT